MLSEWEETFSYLQTSSGLTNKNNIEHLQTICYPVMKKFLQFISSGL